ncbi:uncharacterized protein LOC128547877 isoform X1 [Mercenaria mercenaria]|uniref:uncharacterized protein LOC128547877 isoform X1 n=1 Tax=Mercenaria mercenaria TaxID=6596 RepID=UPI00234F0ACF|nr:uncharacterized protein LOC128547877 isoform X1 [Mercenaria mercenaria]
MISTFKSALACENRRTRLVWILLFLLLNEVKWIHTEESITILSGTCGDMYDAEYYESVSVQYDGSDVLYDNPCSVEFYKASNDHYLCVSGKEIKLDCDTVLEYHDGFVKNYIPPEKKMLCNSTFLDEWCPSQYQDNIYVVIRKPQRSTSDVIRLHVYLKEVPDNDEDSFPTRIILVSVLPAVIIIIISVVVMCIRLKVAHTYGRQSNVAYQTTSGTVNIQGGSPYPTTQPPLGQGGKQQFSGPQGNYNVHTMQTAYPVQGNSAFGQNYSSAAPSNTASLPPPYESVSGMKH